MKHLAFAVTCLSMLVACGPPPKVYWREMLGKAIYDFSDPLPENNNSKVWIHNMDDKECDKGCQTPGGSGTGAAAGAVAAVGGLFGGGGGGGGGGQWDGLAWEVFSNYLTQKRKGKVIEQHHHNYMTETNVSTHKKIEVIESGKVVGTFESCEDLCILDEAKKRKADKILSYQILEMKNDEMLIHLRYSDGKTGLVELSRTLKVVGMSITDSSF
jgi:hypothetical protein